MLDTIRLSIPNFWVRGENKLTLLRTIVAGEERTSGLFEVDGKTVLGTKAFYNSHNWNATIQRKPNGGATLSVSFSSPKVVEGNNLVPASRETFQESVTIVEEELREVGVYADLSDAFLSRVDANRNAQLRFPIPTYAPAFAMLQASRMPNKTQYPHGFLCRNSARQVAMYDKSEEIRLRLLERRKDDPPMNIDLDTIPKNILRAEVRLMDKKSSSRELGGLETVSDLLREYNQLQDMYERTLEGVFKDPPNIDANASVTDVERLLRASHGKGGRGWYHRTLKAVGASQILSALGEDKLKSLLMELGLEKSNARKEVKKVVDLAFDFQASQLILFDETKVSVGDLYEELRHKLAS